LAIIIELCGTTCFALRINDRVIDIENEAEIWAEEMESDFEDFDEGCDGSILDLDVQTIDGKSNLSSFP